MPYRLALCAVALLALVPFAFWPGYLSKWGQADAYTHAHAALGTCWLLLLVAQPVLIQAPLRAWHRRLGRVGVAVGAGFFVSGLLTAHRGLARMNAEQFAVEGRYVYLPLAMTGIFGAALALAVVWRRVAPVHGRFMAATALALLDPLFARLLYFHAPPLPAEPLYQVPAFGLTLVVLAGLLRSLPAGSPGRTAFRNFSAGTAAVLVGFFFIPPTAAWHAVAAWFRALPLT